MRPLTNDDLGIQGKVEKIIGTFSIQDGTATVKIGLIKEDIQNPFEIFKNLQNKAIEAGAINLRIEATVVNEKLYNVLTRRYKMQTLGGIDIIDILLQK
jgi:hypothetical protein